MLDLVIDDCPLRIQFRFEPLCHEHLEQGLIRHVALVGEQFQPIEHRLRQAQRNGLGRRAEVRQGRTLALAPVDIYRSSCAVTMSSILSRAPVERSSEKAEETVRDIRRATRAW